jgi:carbamate kinase
MSKSVLIAIGGNALVKEGEPGSLGLQLTRAAEIGEQIADLVANGYRIVLTHGNGPQVGHILRCSEIAAGATTLEELPDLPIWLAVADSKGGLGHILGMAINNALRRRDLTTRAITILTHVEVEATDPAFTTPTKPIGSVLDEVGAEQKRTAGHQLVAVRGGHRRVIASPRPVGIVELEQIRAAAAGDTVIIAGGGGGIPVVAENRGWHSVEAVVDKDFTSALLAAQLGIETMLLATSVDHAYVGFGTADERQLDQINSAEARRYLAAGEFPPGSMGPKIEASLAYLDNGGRHAVITSLTAIPTALAGNCGTHITQERGTHITSERETT